MGQVLTSGGDIYALCREGGITKKRQLGVHVACWHVACWHVCECALAGLRGLPPGLHGNVSQGAREDSQDEGSFFPKKNLEGWSLSMCTPEFCPSALGLVHGVGQP